MTTCEFLTQIQNLLNEIQTQEFTSVEELKEKLTNVQAVVNAAIDQNCE